MDELIREGMRNPPAGLAGRLPRVQVQAPRPTRPDARPSVPAGVPHLGAFDPVRLATDPPAAVEVPPGPEPAGVLVGVLAPLWVKLDNLFWPTGGAACG